MRISVRSSAARGLALGLATVLPVGRHLTRPAQSVASHQLLHNSLLTETPPTKVSLPQDSRRNRLESRARTVPPWLCAVKSGISCELSIGCRDPTRSAMQSESPATSGN